MTDINQGIAAEKIINEKVDIHNHNYPSDYMHGAMGQRKIKVDLTAEYSYQPRTDKPFDFADANTVVEKLRLERMLFIFGDDYAMVNEAVISLFSILGKSEQLALRSFNQASINETQPVQEKDCDQPSETSLFSFNSFVENCQYTDKKSAIVTDLTLSASLEDCGGFLSMFTRNNVQSGYFSSLKDRLKKEQKYWLILVPSNAMPSSNTTFKKSNQNAFWHPNYILSLIHQFHKSDDISPDILSKQIDDELWEEKIHAIRKVRDEMEQGTFLAKFREHKIALDKGTIQDNPFVGLVSSAHSCHRLYKTIFFIFCHFPRLSPSFFADILCSLLGSQVLTLPLKNQNSSNDVTNKQSTKTATVGEDNSESESFKFKYKDFSFDYDSASGSMENAQIEPATQIDGPKNIKVGSSEIYKEIAAWDYWLENTGAVCRECFITTIENIGLEDSGQYMVMVEHGFKKQARQALQDDNPLYFNSFFQEVYASDLLFHRDNNTANAVAQLFKQKMLHEPSSFDADWLIAWVFEAVRHIDGAEFDEGMDIGALFVRLYKMDEGKNLYTYRWTGLLIELLKEQKLKKTVNNFLRKLIKLSFLSNSVSTIVMQFIRRLRNNQEFDPLYWLKQVILGSNDDDAVKAATRFLTQYIHENIAVNPQLMTMLADWQPSKKHYENLSQIHKVALSIPIDFCCNVFYKPIVHKTIFFDSVFPLVSDYNKKELVSYIDPLISLVTNPSQGFDSDDNINRIIFVTNSLYGDYEVDLDEGQKGPLYFYILKELLEIGREKENLLMTLLLGWSRLLLPKDNVAGYELLKLICAKIAEHLRFEELVLIRKYLKIMRERGIKIKNELPSRELRINITNINKSAAQLIVLLHEEQKTKKDQRG